MDVSLKSWMAERYPAWDLDQAIFVRDEIAPLVNEGIYHDDRSEVRVISQHRSKGMILPVYSITRPTGVFRVVLRNNFYNWKLSVFSDVPVLAPEFPALFHTTPPVEPEYTGDELASCYFEGFPEEWIFGYHSANPSRFSAQIDGGRYPMWATMFAVMRAIGAIKPLEWHTQESHRKELDEDRKRWEARRKTA